jgi:DMSO/TMAO reductase YedYZ molybdopterin-dependent catalytic subunit
MLKCRTFQTRTSFVPIDTARYALISLEQHNDSLVKEGARMGIISRGFSGRRNAANVKLPPGQYFTTDFPVLSAGPTPHVPLDRWEFTVDDGAYVLRRRDWKSFRDLPTEVITVDLHCVTR